MKETTTTTTTTTTSGEQKTFRYKGSLQQG